jgi:photosystem II stability/assembly factor-like uncharacterized protein
MKISKILFLTIIVVLCSQQQKIYSQQTFWKQINNKNPFTGLEVDALLSLKNGNILAGTNPGLDYDEVSDYGIFVSTDNGSSWKLTCSKGGGSAFTVCPNGHIFAIGFYGIYRSTDDGYSWQSVENLREMALAASSNGTIFVGRFDGVSRSTDDGQTWVQINNGLTNTYVNSLTVDSYGNVFAGTNAGTFRSTDNGDHWAGGGTVKVNSLSVNPMNGHIFAGTNSGIYRSSDQGQNWSNVGFPNGIVPVIHIDTAGKILEMSSSSGTQLGGLYESTDDGNSWICLSPSAYGPCFTVASSGSIFYGEYKYNFFRSTDNGATWESIPHILTDSWITSLASDKNGSVFAGTYGSYIFKTSDNGNSWTQYTTGLAKSVIAFSSDSKGNLFAGCDSGGIYRSIDSGKTWLNVNNGIGNNIHVFAFAIDSRNTIFAGCNPSGTSGGGVYISSNNGAHWTQLTSTSGNVYSLALSPSGKFFAGTNDGKVYFSLDSGTTWNNTIITSTTVRSLIVDQFGNIFAGTDYPDGLYRSTDNGNSWSNIGFTNVSVTSLISNPVLGIYLGTWGQGVFHSTDNGTTWNAVSDGLSDNNVLSLTFDASGYFYAGTQSSGVFRSAQPLITDVQYLESHTPKQFMLSQNYPNPFNPTTTISFSLPRSEFARLKIFDLMGREITTLISKNLAAGNYSFKWDASNQPSGVYFYQLQAGQYSETRKLLLLK